MSPKEAFLHLEAGNLCNLEHREGVEVGAGVNQVHQKNERKIGFGDSNGNSSYLRADPSTAITWINCLCYGFDPGGSIVKQNKQKIRVENPYSQPNPIKKTIFHKQMWIFKHDLYIAMPNDRRIGLNLVFSSLTSYLSFGVLTLSFTHPSFENT